MTAMRMESKHGRLRITSGCYKRTYYSEREARRALKSTRRGGMVAFYECPRCGHYHLTSHRQEK